MYSIYTEDNDITYRSFNVHNSAIVFLLMFFKKTSTSLPTVTTIVRMRRHQQRTNEVSLFK